MAKKLTLSDLDFSRADNTPDWAVQLRLDYENQQNKEREVAAQVDAIVKDYESRGEPLRDSEIASLFQAMSNGEDWTRPASADFSNVESGATSSPPTDPNSWEGRKEWLGQQLGEVGTFAKNTLGNLQSSAAGAGALAADYGDVIFPYASDESKAAALEISKGLQGRAATNLQEAQAELEQIKENYPDWMVDTVADITGTPSSAASIIGGPAAVIPGADVFLQEYGQARAADLSPEEALTSATIQGGIETGVSAIPSGKLLGKLPVIGAPIKRLEKGLADSLESRFNQALHTATRAAVTATGEGIEEGVTGIAQDAAYRLQGLLGPEKAAEYAAASVQGELGSDAYWESMVRQARAGFFMGGGIGGLQAAVTAAPEGARQRQAREDTLDSSINTNLGNELLRQRTDADLADLKTDTTLNQDIALEEQRIADEEAKQQAFEQAEKAAAEQRELEEEAGFQTLERADTPAGTVVERTGRKGLANVVERVPAEPVRPEAVAEQRAAEQRAADEQAERVKQGKLAEELRKRREAAQKKVDSEQKKQTRAQRLAEKKRRDFIADQVLSENPDATEAELTEEYERRLADETIQPPEKAAAKPEPTLEDRVQKVRDNLERAQKGKVSRMQTERIKAVVRRNPDLSVEDIASQLRQEGQVGVVPDAEPIVPARDNKPAPANVIPAPTKSDKSQTEQDFDNFADKIGLSLGMAAKPRATKDNATHEIVDLHTGKVVDHAIGVHSALRKVDNRDNKYGGTRYQARRIRENDDPATLGMAGEASSTESSLEDFKPKAKTFIKALVGRTSKDSRDVQTLIHQGKIIVAPNATVLGRPEGNRQAEYDMDTGKMYLYLDNMADLNDPVGHIAAALHETNHALLTEGEIGAAAGKIRTAANKGNKFAQAAVRKAQADTDARNGDTTFENEEVVAYFASETKAAEGKPLGSVGAVVRDLTSAAKGAIRKYTGLDLNVSIGEVATALNAALGDATTREITGRGTGGSLGMIVGPSAVNWSTLKNKYTGKVDSKERSEIADVNAEITTDPETLKDLISGEKVPLGEVLSHDRLYSEYPDLVKIPVVANKLGGSTQAMWDGRNIHIDSAFVRSAMSDPVVAGENMRRLILHELQHAIQQREGFVGGANSRSFIPPAVLSSYDLSSDRYEGFVKAFELGIAENTLRPSEQSKWTATLNRSGNPTDRRARAILFLENGHAAGSSERLIQRAGERYKQVKDNLFKDRAEMLAAERRAFATYLRDYGEGEARNTETRSRFDEQSLEAMPPESTMGVDDSGVTVDEMVDTRQLARRRQALPSVSQSLGMAASQTPEAKAVRRDPTVVKWQTWARNLFQNSKGLGPEMLEAFEHAKSSPAGEEARANNSLGKYNAALRQLAKQRGVTMEALNDQIMKELDAIDNQTNGYDANIAAYKAVVGKYGEAGQHLLNLRNQVDALTKEMLRQRAAANVKPTAAETKQLTTLVNNAGRYSHRLYAAYQGKAGKKYANAIMDVYEKGRAWDNEKKRLEKQLGRTVKDSEVKKGKKLTPEQKDTYDMVERALKTLIDDNLMIPDDAGLAEMGGDELVRLYKTWGKHLTSAISLDGMRDELAERRDSINGDSDRLRVMAEEIASDLLDLTNTDKPIAVYYRGSKQDRGILQERAKIPAAIRALMGEITDPGTRLLATVAKQAEFVARTKFLLEVKDNIDPSHLQPADAGGTPAVVNNAMQKLEGEGYGPLNGWYASPQLRSMLSDVRESLANFEQVTAMAGTDPGKLTNAAVDKILEKWMKVAGWSKRAQIVGNLFLQPLNWAGATMMPLVNGNLNPATYGRGLQDAVNLIRYARNPSLGLRSASDAVTYGITDSATIGELKGLPYEKIQDFARTMAGKSPSKGLRFIKEAGLTLQEAYAMMDVWAKIANFHNEVNQLTSYYKKNGEARTEEQIKREAANITNRTNITYKRAVPVIKALERGGFTNFGTYFYEVFRSQIGNFAQGMQEMTQGVANATTPAAKAAKLQRGMTRVGGQAAYWYAAAQVSSLLSSLMFGDDDDEWDKRALYPEYMQNQDLYTVGYDENGVPVVFSVSRVDAVGPATDIMRQAMIGGMSMEQAKDEVLNLYVRPRIVPQMYNLGKTLWNNTAPTKEPVIQHLTPTGYEYLLKGTRAAGIEDKSTKAWTNLVEAAFGPGTYMAYRESNPTPVAPAEGGDGVQQMALIAKYMGATFTKPDPNSAVFFANKDYEDTIKIGRKDLANAFKDRPNITASEISSFVDEAIEAERAEWNKLARVYRGMEAHGMKAADINKVLKDAKLDAGTIRSLKQQKFDPSVVSKRSFEQQINRELSKLSDEDKKAFKANWEKAWKRLETVSKEGRQ